MPFSWLSKPSASPKPKRSSKPAPSLKIKEEDREYCPVECDSCWRTYGMKRAYNRLGDVHPSLWPSLPYQQPKHLHDPRISAAWAQVANIWNDLTLTWSTTDGGLGLQGLYLNILEKREEVQTLVADLGEVCQSLRRQLASKSELSQLAAFKILVNQAELSKAQAQEVGSRLSYAGAAHYRLAVYAGKAYRSNFLEVAFSEEAGAWEIHPDDGRTEAPWSIPLTVVARFWKERAEGMKANLEEEERTLAMIKGEMPWSQTDQRADLHSGTMRNQSDRTEERKFTELYKLASSQKTTPREAKLHEFQVKIKAVLAATSLTDLRQQLADAIPKYRGEQEMHIEALDREVLRLKEDVSTITLDKESSSEENQRLKALLDEHEIPYVVQDDVDESPSTEPLVGSFDGEPWERAVSFRRREAVRSSLLDATVPVEDETEHGAEDVISSLALDSSPRSISATPSSPEDREDSPIRSQGGPITDAQEQQEDPKHNVASAPSALPETSEPGPRRRTSDSFSALETVHEEPSEASSPLQEHETETTSRSESLKEPTETFQIKPPVFVASPSSEITRDKNLPPSAPRVRPVVPIFPASGMNPCSLDDAYCCVKCTLENADRASDDAGSVPRETHASSGASEQTVGPEQLGSGSTDVTQADSEVQFNPIFVVGEEPENTNDDTIDSSNVEAEPSVPPAPPSSPDHAGDASQSGAMLGELPGLSSTLLIVEAEVTELVGTSQMSSLNGKETEDAGKGPDLASETDADREDELGVWAAESSETSSLAQNDVVEQVKSAASRRRSAGELRMKAPACRKEGASKARRCSQ